MSRSELHNWECAIEKLSGDNADKMLAIAQDIYNTAFVRGKNSISLEKTKWIPCSEQLPEEDGHYIVYAPSYRGGSSGGKEKHNGVMFSRFKNGKWSIEVGYHKRPGCVKAWMPIVPWEGEGDD